MFEDVLDQELAKYDKFIGWLKDLETKQEELMQSIRVGDSLKLWLIAKAILIRGRTRSFYNREETTFLSRIENVPFSLWTFPTRNIEKYYETYKKELK